MSAAKARCNAVGRRCAESPSQDDVVREGTRDDSLEGRVVVQAVTVAVSVQTSFSRNATHHQANCCGRTRSYEGHSPLRDGVFRVRYQELPSVQIQEAETMLVRSDGTSPIEVHVRLLLVRDESRPSAGDGRSLPYDPRLVRSALHGGELRRPRGRQAGAAVQEREGAESAPRGLRDPRLGDPKEGPSNRNRRAETPRGSRRGCPVTC